MKILVVDDEKSIRDVLVKLLKFKNFEAKDAESGFKAIELVQQEKFDIVFLDVRMPQMDGLQALESLKKINPETKYIMMTGYAEEGLVENILEKGASACLRKPFSIDEIMSKIKELT